jgi:Ni/Co efflux regulator RcnB
MKQILIMLLALASLSISCSQQDREARDIQREESFGKDDFRESDNYERTLPLEPDSKSAQ